MNIFYLDSSPALAAKYHNDKHVVKMILESAQMLSTAHRVLDGKEQSVLSKSGKRVIKKYKIRRGDKIFYTATHIKHPCTLWTMQTNKNYQWHVNFFMKLCEEYTYRYGKTHLSEIRLADLLSRPPKNIPSGKKTQPPQVIPSEFYDKCFVKGDAVAGYRNYYKSSKITAFSKYTRRHPPAWL